MNSRLLFILLVLAIVIFILGTIALFSYLGISLNTTTKTTLKKAIFLETNNREEDTFFIN